MLLLLLLLLLLVHRSMGLYFGELIIRWLFVNELWGAYFREGLFSEGLIILILRHFCTVQGQFL